jgi:hypothetical protein
VEVSFICHYQIVLQVVVIIQELSKLRRKARLQSSLIYLTPIKPESDWWILRIFGYGPNKLAPPKSNSRRLVAEGSNVLGDKYGSGPPKPRCEALCRLRGTEVVIVVSQAILCGSTGQHPSYALPSTRVGLYWWWLFNSPVLVGLIRTTRYLQKKNWLRIQISSLR